MNKVILEVQAKLRWVFFRDAESKNWIAVCDPLQVTVEAGTHSDLVAQIECGIDLLFRDLMNRGRLESFLHHRGWSISGEMNRSGGDVHFDVPIELISESSRRDTQRAHH